jgi:hypothetical protein
MGLLDKLHEILAPDVFVESPDVSVTGGYPRYGPIATHQEGVSHAAGALTRITPLFQVSQDTVVTDFSANQTAGGSEYLGYGVTPVWQLTTPSQWNYITLEPLTAGATYRVLIEGEKNPLHMRRGEVLYFVSYDAASLARTFNVYVRYKEILA